MLSAQGIKISFSGLPVLQGVNLDVKPGSITGLIGPNGAGKSTLFNCLAGYYRADAGTVTLEGKDVTRLATHELANRGLVRTFQVPREFGNLTVLENLLVAAPSQEGERLLSIFLRPGAIARQEEQIRNQAREILEFLRLTHIQDELAKNLSGGQKKLLELGRTLMLKPRLLLLDEPVAGVNPTLAREISERIQELRARGMTFLIIEHNMDVIMELSDVIYVMAEGKNLMHGTPDEVRNDQRVLNAYLGVA